MMNNYVKLIQTNMLAFKDLLLKNYKKIGLTDLETMTIMHLFDQKKEQDQYLSINYLTNLMSLSETEISEMVFRLVEKGFINIEIDQNHKETFSLDPTYEKISLILDNDQITNNTEELRVTIIEFIQKLYQRDLTTTDLQIINRWATEIENFEELEKIIMECFRSKKTNLRYVDAVVVSKRNQQNRPNDQSNVDPQIKEMLDSINVRRRY